MVGKMIPSREMHNILSGPPACLLVLRVVLRAGVYDNEDALVSRRGAACVAGAIARRIRSKAAQGELRIVLPVCLVWSSRTADPAASR